jgi:hypothetical protein
MKINYLNCSPMNRTNPLQKYPVCAIAYYVESVEAAAREHSRLFGSGPFFAIPDVTSTILLHGRDLRLNQSTAFGQWGSQMVELVQQNPGSDPLVREVFPWPSEGMLHHLAVLVDDFARERERLHRVGLEEILRVEFGEGLRASFFDTRKLYGHLIELYPSTPQMLNFFKMVSDASENWNGEEPFRTLSMA